MELTIFLTPFIGISIKARIIWWCNRKNFKQSETKHKFYCRPQWKSKALTSSWIEHILIHLRETETIALGTKSPYYQLSHLKRSCELSHLKSSCEIKSPNHNLSLQIGRWYKTYSAILIVSKSMIEKNCDNLNNWI